MTAEQMASMFTQLAIREMIESFFVQMSDLDFLDREYGTRGRDHRQKSRESLALKIEIAQHALQLRKESGRR